MGENIYFEDVFSTTKENLFYKRIIELVNRLYLNDQKYQKNVTIRE